MKKHCPKASSAGFTLVEIMVAVAILGSTLLVLLDAHYGALNLFTGTRDSLLMENFMERAMGEAEVQVLAGELNGTGDFGKKYPEYSYSFSAQSMGDQWVPLYTVAVTVKGPAESRDMQMLVYSIMAYQ